MTQTTPSTPSTRLHGYAAIEYAEMLARRISERYGPDAQVIHAGRAGTASSPVLLWDAYTQVWTPTPYQECQWHDAVEACSDGASMVVVLSDVWDERRWETQVRAVLDVEYTDYEYDPETGEETEEAPEGEGWRSSIHGGWYRLRERDSVPHGLRELVRDAVAEWKSEQRR